MHPNAPVRRCPRFPQHQPPTPTNDRRTPRPPKQRAETIAASSPSSFRTGREQPLGKTIREAIRSTPSEAFAGRGPPRSTPIARKATRQAPRQLRFQHTRCQAFPSRSIWVRRRLRHRPPAAPPLSCFQRDVFLPPTPFSPKPRQRETRGSHLPERATNTAHARDSRLPDVREYWDSA